MRTFLSLTLAWLLLVPSSGLAAGPTMSVHFIDVGQGDATLLEFPCGAVLVDTGGEDSWGFDGGHAVTTYLSAFFQRRKDLARTLKSVILTHPHPDHTRGLAEVVTVFMVDHIVDNGQEEPPDDHSDEDDEEHLTQAFEKRLRNALEDDFEIVGEPRPETLRIRAAITEADPSWVWLNIVGVILVVPPDMGGISAEVEVLDALTGERLIAMTARRDGTVFLLLECFSTWGHARHGMKKWSRILASILSEEDEGDGTEGELASAEGTAR